MKKSMVISLIGRPNVGKSSIFNRLMRRANKALTHDEPGVTRDRHYGITHFDDLPNEDEAEAILVDTGGFYPERIEEDENNVNKFFNIMTDHAHIAIDESDLVLFVVDVREGSLPFDESIANYIRSKKKNFWLLINKYDSDKQMGEEAEFYNLGLDPEQMFTMSAAHGIGVETLRERLHGEILEHGKASETSSDLQRGVTPKEQVVGRLALVGAPNAGKSTLLNQLLGAERALVSDIPGTTVDPIEGFFDLYFGSDALELEEETNFVKNDGLLYKQYEDFRKNNPDVYQSLVQAYEVEESDATIGTVELEDEIIEEEEKEFDSMYEKVFSEPIIEEIEAPSQKATEGSFWRSLHLVDTAGIRKQRSIKDFIESQSVYRSLRCITESDIVLFLVDATKGIGHQDRRLIDIALEKGKSVIVCLNKVDILKEQLKDDNERKEWLQNMRDQVPWLHYCDLLPISAKYKRGMKALKTAIKKTILVRRRSIPTGELNRFMVYLTDKHPISPKGSGGKRFKIKYASMVKSDPPTFLFFTNKSRGLPENYRRYLKNGLRSQFDLSNTPVHLLFRTGGDLERRFKERSSTN